MSHLAVLLCNVARESQQAAASGAGDTGSARKSGQGVICAAARQLVPPGQGALQGAHLCPQGAGPAQGLLAGAGQGGL